MGFTDFSFLYSICLGFNFLDTTSDLLDSRISGVARVTWLGKGGQVPRTKVEMVCSDVCPEASRFGSSLRMA